MSQRLIRQSALGATVACWLVMAGHLPIATAHAQNSPAPGRTATPGTITGVVVSGATGLSLRNARVRISGLGLADGLSVDREMRSDASGRFSFGDLPAGRFALFASHDEFRPAEFGQTKPGTIGLPVTLGDGQVQQITIPLWRGSAIVGTVQDELGDPMVGAAVRLLAFVVNQNNVRRLRVVQTSISDDRGAYRFFGLDPAGYHVSATPRLPGPAVMDPASGDVNAAPRTVGFTVVRDGTVVSAISSLPNDDDDAFAPTYAPQSATVSGSLAIVVDGIAERAGIDVQVLSRRMGRITGMVAGIPAANAPVQVLLHNTEAEEETTSQTTMTGPDGQFELRNVIPGHYLVFAQTLPRPDAAQPFDVQAVRVSAFERLHGRTPITVEAGVATPVVVQLRSGRSIAGRVVYNLTAGRPSGNKTATMISITPAPQPTGLPAFNTSPQVAVAADGTFTLPGIRPGRYLLRASGPGTVASVMLNGVDTLDDPIEVTADADVVGAVITLTDRVSQLSGRVIDADGQPGYGYTVVAATTTSRFWGPGARRVATVRPGVDGRYAIGGLPAGEYRVAAVRDFSNAQPLDAQTLPALLRGAVTITITDAARAALDLHVGR